MIFGIFLVSLLAAVGMDARVEMSGMRLTRGQADSLYLIMIVSVLGMVVTLSGMLG